MRPILALALVACAPISTQSRTIEHVVSRDHMRESSGEDTIAGSARPTADTLIIEARTEKHCRELDVEHVRLSRDVTRSAFKPVLVGEIVLGIAFAGSGGFLIWDNRDEHSGRVLAPDVKPETGGAIGISVAALGGLLLLATTIDGVRARDRVEDVGIVDRKRPSSTATTCGETPARSLAIVGVTAAGEVPLGSTDATGKLVIAWDAVPPALVEGANPRPEARLVARVGERTWPLGQVSLETARRLLAARARKEAEAADAPERWDELASRFPDEHGTEASRRARELRIKRVRDALVAGDVVAARVQLGALEGRDKDNPETKALADEVAAREATAARDEAWKQADAAVAAADATGPIERFAAADVALKAAETLSADPRGTELHVRLDRARAQRLKDALARIKKAKGDAIDAARAALTEAEVLAPASADVLKAKAAVDTLEVTSLRTRARARIAAKDYGEADALLARAIELRPDAALVKERDRVAKLAARQGEPTKVGAVTKTEPTKTEPTKTEPTKTDAVAKTEPPKTQPTKTEPAKATDVAITTTAVPRPEVPANTPAPNLARADAKYRLRAGTARAPIDWLALPTDCAGSFVGNRVALDCGEDQLVLVRDDLDVTLTCNAKTCGRCKELQRGLVSRGKVDPPSERCQEAAP